MTLYRNIITVLIAVLLAGCAGSSPAVTPTIVYVTPAPTATPSPTPSPTPAPTPRPTPTPAPTPTPSPTPVPTPDPLAGTTTFAAYTDRQSAANSKAMDVLQDIVDDLSYYDLDSVMTDGNRLYVLATAEVKWLKSHLPQPCYARLHAEQLAVWVDTQSAGKKLKAGSLDTNGISKGTAHLVNINEGGLWDDAVSACAADPGTSS